MSLREEIEKVLDEQVRPFLISHGGNIEFVDITEDNIVQVKLEGGCSGCSCAQSTLKDLVENTLIENIPQIKGVEAVK